RALWLPYSELPHYARWKVSRLRPIDPGNLATERSKRGEDRLDAGRLLQPHAPTGLADLSGDVGGIGVPDSETMFSGAKQSEGRMTTTFTRPMVAAGSFYPREPSSLRSLVASFLDRARPPAILLKALIAPHAGYLYSGPIAGSAFAPLGKTEQSPAPSRVIL